MPYSTPTDIRRILAPGEWPYVPEETAPKTNTAADLPDSQLQDAIVEADALIDAYIGGRYATPVAAVAGVTPIPVRFWSRDIAAYGATLTNRKGRDLTPQDPVALRYAQVMVAMTAARDGKSTLQIPVNTGASSTAGAATPVNPYTGKLFDAEDFNLVPLNPGWPHYPDIPSGSYPWGW